MLRIVGSLAALGALLLALSMARSRSPEAAPAALPRVATLPGLAPLGADWPQFRGPRRDGISSETGLRVDWDTTGPPQRWRVPLGAGFSGLSVSGGTLYTMYADRSREYLAAFDVDDGSQRWRLAVDDRYRNGQGDGPRSTPTVAGGRVFALSAGGVLLGADATSGEALWRHDLRSAFGARAPTWGFSTSPLVDGPRVLMEVGGDSAALVAFDAATGAEVWRSLDDPAGYSAPILAELAGHRHAVFFTGSRIVGVDPTSGSLHWSLGWRTSAGVNAATPVLVPPNGIFVSSGYGVGSALLRITAASGSPQVETVWRNREMKNQFSTSVRVGGHLYGFDDSILECIDLSNGERMWRARGFGHGSLLFADGKLVVLGANGTLALVAASPGEYAEIARARIFDSRTWTAPTLARGSLYVRDERELVALDMHQPEA